MVFCFPPRVSLSAKGRPRPKCPKDPRISRFPALFALFRGETFGASGFPPQKKIREIAFFRFRPSPGISLSAYPMSRYCCRRWPRPMLLFFSFVGRLKLLVDRLLANPEVMNQSDKRTSTCLKRLQTTVDKNWAKWEKRFGTAAHVGPEAQEVVPGPTRIRSGVGVRVRVTELGSFRSRSVYTIG